MPRLSGPELCQQIKLNRPGISCLLMSGNMSGIRLPEDVPFISKPFAPDFFRLKVQELLAAVKLESPNLHEFTSTGLQ